MRQSLKVASAITAVVLVMLTWPSIASAQSETVEYYGLDALGSVRVIFDQQGNVVDRMDYDPFGANLRAAIKFPTEQFAQLARDAESGKDYAEARTYSLQTGRFNRVDSVYAGLFEPQLWNRYTYVLSNPASLTDPSGQFPYCDEQPVFCEGDSDAMQRAALDSLLLRNRPPRRGQLPRPPPRPPIFEPDPPERPNIPTAPAPPASDTITCTGTARVLLGNPDTIGRPGGFSGDTVGEILVTQEGAAVIPRQWAATRTELRPHLNAVTGTFPDVNASFTGIVDTIGGTPPSGYTNVQDGLLDRNPGRLIIELPGGAKDYGVTVVSVTVPASLGCPSGTTAVR